MKFLIGERVYLLAPGGTSGFDAVILQSVDTDEVDKVHVGIDGRRGMPNYAYPHLYGDMVPATHVHKERRK